jgi:hypothetical protein
VSDEEPGGTDPADAEPDGDRSEPEEGNRAAEAAREADPEHEADPEPMSDQIHPEDDQAHDQDDDGRDVERYVRYVLLAGFTLLALVALLRFYFAASGAIDTWVTDEYRSLFQAAFNLVVLFAAGIGISWQVRQLA